MDVSKLQVCIVGGGNAAHALAALFPSRGVKTVMWASYADEAERINKGIAEQGHIKANFASHNDPAGEVTGKPAIVTKDAKDVVPESDVFILPVPSFTYRPLLLAMKPFLRKGQIIGVTPGQGGFDWIAKEVLGDIAKDLIFFSLMPMPFNCRIKEFGKEVDVQTFKRRYRVGTIPESATSDVVSICSTLFGDTTSVGHFLSCTLYPINAIIHPQRLYSLLKNWKEGDILPENPLFYESMDKDSTDMMDKVNKEICEVGRVLRETHGMNVDVPHIFDFLSWVYTEANPKNMIELFANNDAYKGFRCPFKKEGDGFVPDFTNRYFTEDIPLGLCIYKGVADIAGVATPTMDTVLSWAQGHMGKEYLKDGSLSGKDVGETAAPQVFGVKNIEQLKAGHS